MKGVIEQWSAQNVFHLVFGHADFDAINVSLRDVVALLNVEFVGLDDAGYIVGHGRTSGQSERQQGTQKQIQS